MDRTVLNKNLKQYLKALCSTLAALSMVLSPLVHASMLSVSGLNSIIVDTDSLEGDPPVVSAKASNCHPILAMVETVQQEPDNQALPKAKHVNHSGDASASDACKAFCTTGVDALSAAGILVAGLMRHFVAAQLTVSDYIPISSTPLLRPPRI